MTSCIHFLTMPWLPISTHSCVNLGLSWGCRRKSWGKLDAVWEFGETEKPWNTSFADVKDLVESAALAVFICSHSTSSSAPWIWLPLLWPLETTLSEVNHSFSWALKHGTFLQHFTMRPFPCPRSFLLPWPSQPPSFLLLLPLWPHLFHFLQALLPGPIP